MEINFAQVVVAGLAALAVPSLSYFLTKRHEVKAAQYNLKLGQYQKFMTALAGVIDGEATVESLARYGRATNTLQLVACNAVIVALHRYREQTAFSNKNRSIEVDDQLLSSLVWQIRRDLGNVPTANPADFSARLRASGPPSLSNRD